MAMVILVPIDLGLNEIRNVLLQQLAADPSPTEAQIYYNTVSHQVRYYNGTVWVPLVASTGGTVTSVTGTAPIQSSGGTTPAISIVAATGSVPGSMSAADKTKLDASVAAATPSTLILRDAAGRAQVVSPSAAADIATKSYVDGLINGVAWGPAVTLVATTNVATLSGVATTIDGVTATAGMRVLLTAQTTGSQNGPWVVNSGAWTRPLDYPAGGTASPNIAYFVSQGTARHDTGWTLSTDAAVTVDTTATAWTQFTGLGEVTAGNGLTKSADTISAQAADGSITVTAGGIAVTNPVAYGSPGASAVGDTAADGVATTEARSDHRHAREAFATPAIVLGAAAAAGVATTHIRSDATVAAFDATAPSTQAFGDAAAVGTAAFAARRDHKHAMPANPTLRFSVDVGDNSSTAIVITHNLGTRDVQVQLYRNSTPWDTVLCDVERTTTNTCTLRFTTAPTTNQFRAVVQG